MKKSKFITDFKDIPGPREKMPHLPLEERESFREVELGFEEERAVREAKRCLSCRRCIGCGLCLAECDPRAVVYDEKEQMLNLKVDAVVLTPGFDEFDAGRIRELGYRQFPNVITSIELERMLSNTGPYGGVVLRPYDGDLPARIAFIQCVGSRSEALGADYCSSICCMSAMREALSLVTQISDARVTILHRDMRPLGKGSEEFYQSVLKEPRVDLVPAVVVRVEENPESKNLVIEFSSRGKAQREEYDLVVLSVGIRPSSTARLLSRATGVKLNKYGFCLTDPFTPALTSKTGIVAAGAFVGPGGIEQSVCQADAAAGAALQRLSSGVLKTRGSISSSILVIGSGIAGLTAAHGLSALGHDVTVIEKEQEPGGIAKRFSLPSVSSLLEAIESIGKVKLLTCTELARFSGELGCFKTALRSNGKEKEENFGAVVVCTGGKEYVPEGVLYGEDNRVVTQLEFEVMLKAGAIDASAVAMIQCVGSRCSDWPVCSRTCCEQALRNALKMKQLKPDTKVTILHRDIRVYFVEEELFSEAKEKGVEFVALKDKDSVSRPASSPYVTVNAGEKLSLAFDNQASGAGETMSVDLVVLSTGFRPDNRVAELAGMLGIRIDDKGFFAEIHAALRPVESSTNGIYICGLAHSPQSVSETTAQAMAAAKKASSAIKRLFAEAAV